MTCSDSASTTSPTFAVIDTETTGFSPRTDRVIEIGVCVTDRDFHEVSRWETLIHPAGVNIRNSRIHGITDTMVRDAPTFGGVLAELAEVLDGLVPIAHSARFDQSMLNADYARLAATHRLTTQQPLIADIADSLTLARTLLPGQSHKLDDLLTSFGLTNAAAHTAGADAAATAELLTVMFGDRRRQVADTMLATTTAFTAGRLPLDIPATQSTKPRAALAA
jgi:DNA polymerase-3 subunit epsilon